jgi:hypothetical protein
METCEQTISAASRPTYQLVEQEVNLGIQAFKSGKGKIVSIYEPEMEVYGE